MHFPVLLHESIVNLNLKKGDIVVDGTLGLGGHSEKILEQILPDGLLIAFDQDQANMKKAQERLKDYQDNILYCSGNFQDLDKFIPNKFKEKISAIFLDLGVASTHFDQDERGFSYTKTGPLDMRMDQRLNKTAKDVISNTSCNELTEILKKYGEVRSAYKLAKKIVQARKEKTIKTTQDLTTIIEQVFPVPLKRAHPAQKVFQALRIEVNDELQVLEKTLLKSLKFLRTGGRLAVISYHSLEDRIVKHFFKEQAKPCICPREFLRCQCLRKPPLNILTKKPIVPTREEIEKNRRSRSAKLRLAIRTHNPLRNI
jgi:16S rRNA (cytosine1402-N4)-methyltransferase